MNRKLFCLALAASLAFTIGGTAQAQPASQTLRFGVEASYPPFESKTASGQLEGFDIDWVDDPIGAPD